MPSFAVTMHYNTANIEDILMFYAYNVNAIKNCWHSNINSLYLVP